MKSVTRYILRTLLLAVAFVTLAVTAAVWLTQSLKYVDIVVENGAPLHMFIWLALLTLPVFLSLALPIALFVGVLFTFHRLTQDSELIAMRACGMSPRTLAQPALQLAFFTVLIGYALTLYLQPLASQELIRLQYFVQSQFTAALLKEGTFNDLGNKMTIYVAERTPDAQLKDLLIYDGRDPVKSITIRAARGQLVQSKQGPQVIVYDGIQQQYNILTHRFDELVFDTYAVGVENLMPATKERAASPKEKPFFALFKDFMNEADPRVRARLSSEFHQRLLSPLLSLAFVVIACLSLLFGEYNRRGQSKRIIAAIAGAGAVEVGVMGFSQVAAEHQWAVIMLYLVVILPIVLGLWKIRQSDCPGKLFSAERV